jgi:hypothetical protein
VAFQRASLCNKLGKIHRVALELICLSDCTRTVMREQEAAIAVVWVVLGVSEPACMRTSYSFMRVGKSVKGEEKVFMQNKEGFWLSHDLQRHKTANSRQQIAGNS